MRLRKLALAVGLAGSLGASVANALGLGEIKLNSTLNQPLDAEIALLQVRDLTEAEILVRLASREDFQRAGVDRLFFLTDLRFQIDLDSRGGPVIKVTSRKPVREPYLNFLMETQWPSGRLLREYTLLMDLPTFGDESVRPIQGAQTKQAAARQTPTRPATTPPQAEPEGAATAERPSVQRREGDRPGVEVYGPVTAEDTLWEIALRVRPGRSVSVHQTMLALQRLNPGAFIKGNINLLRKGQVLRVPTQEQIKNITIEQAVNEVAYQNNEWNGDSKEPATGAQLDATKRTVTDRPTQQSIEGRVKLAAASAAQSAEDGKGSGAKGGSVEALENELTAALEELDRSKRTNAELTSRISELEEQISTMERLLQVSNEELRALQLASQQRSEEAAAALPAAPVAGQEPSAPEAAPSVAQTKPATPETQAAPQVQPSKTTAETVAKAKPADAAKKVVRSSKPKEPSLIEMLMDNILLVGAGLLAIIAGAFLALRRRGEEPEEAFDEIAEAPEFEAQPQEEPTELIQDEEPEEAFELDVEDELELPEEQPVSAEAETGDVVGEADIYIAYGKFDQAEEMLLKALDKEPESTDIRVKLLEVYAETQNLERFDQHFLQLQSLGDDFAQQRAAELRQNIPGAGEFDSNAVSLPEAADTVAADAEIDLALDLNGLDEPELESALIEDSKEPEDELSLDLDLDLDEKVDEALNELEFDLGDDALSLEDEDAGSDELKPLAGGEEPSAGGEEPLAGGEEPLAGGEEPSAELYEPSAELYEPSAEEDQPASDSDELTLELDEDIELDASLDDIGTDLDLDLTLSEDALDKDEELEFELDLSDELADVNADAEIELDLGLGEDAEEAKDSTEDALDLGDTDLDLDIQELAEELDAESLNLDKTAEEEGALNLTLEGELGELAADVEDQGEVADASDEGQSNLSDAEPNLNDWGAEALSDDALDLGTDKNLLNDEDDFDPDLELEDIDLEALDQELDNLAAGLDLTEGDESPGDEPEFDLSLEGLEKGEDELSVAPDKLETDSESVADQDTEEPSTSLENDLDITKLEQDVFAESSEPDTAMPDFLGGDAFSEEELSEEDLDGELDFLSGSDETATKLDLARAYIDMGDTDGAKDILDEVTQEGNDQQRQEAEELLGRIT